MDAPTDFSLTLPQTLTSIFFDPSQVFQSLRFRPRFLAAALVSIIAVLSFSVAFVEKVGFQRIVRAQVEMSSRTRDLPPEKRAEILEQQSNPAFRYIGYIFTPIVMGIVFLVSAALYLAGAALMGGEMGFKQSLALTTYSSLPPTVLSMLANIIILLIKPLADSEIAKSQQGLVQANLSLLVDTTKQPILGALLGGFDVFTFYGLFLAYLGLRYISKLTSSAALGVVAVMWILTVLLKITFAALFG